MDLRQLPPATVMVVPHSADPCSGCPLNGCPQYWLSPMTVVVVPRGSGSHGYLHDACLPLHLSPAAILTKATVTLLHDVLPRISSLTPPPGHSRFSLRLFSQPPICLSLHPLYGPHPCAAPAPPTPYAPALPHHHVPTSLRLCLRILTPTLSQCPSLHAHVPSGVSAFPLHNCCSACAEAGVWHHDGHICVLASHYKGRNATTASRASHGVYAMACTQQVGAMSLCCAASIRT